MAELVPPTVRLTTSPTTTVLAALGRAASTSPAAEPAWVMVMTPPATATPPIAAVRVASPVASAPAVTDRIATMVPATGATAR